MEGFEPKPETFAFSVTILSLILISSVKGQISTQCTASMVSRFTPCMNYITGSTADSSSPTSSCCDALQSLMSSNADCGCLLVTASLPMPMGYISRNLALSLPSLCGTEGVPLQCKSESSSLPAPSPDSAFSPQASKAAAASDKPAADQQPEASPPIKADGPSATSWVGPTLIPSASASTPPMISSQTTWMMLMGFSLFKFF